MRMYHAAVLSVAVLSAAAYCAQRGQTRDGTLALKELSASNAGTRKDAHEELLRCRNATVAALVHIGQTRKKSYGFLDERELAVRLLGELRAVEAVDTLLQDITFSPPQVVWDLSVTAQYPCAEALVRIGRPSVQTMLHRVDRRPPMDALALHVRVIQMVEGDQELGALRIRKALKDAAGGRKQYLEALLKLYEKTPFPGAYSWQ